MKQIGKFCLSCKATQANHWRKSPRKRTVPRPQFGIGFAKWRDAGIIKQSTTLLDAETLGFEACFFVLIRTSEHEASWQAAFLQALNDRPEVQEAHRLAGDIDYILKVRVKNARAYDNFYQALISEVKVHNVTALLSMEEIKSTTQLPL